MSNAQEKQVFEELYKNIEQHQKMEDAYQAVASIADQYKHKKEELFSDFMVAMISSVDNENLFQSFKVFYIISLAREKFKVCLEQNLPQYLEKVHHDLKKEQDPEANHDAQMQAEALKEFQNKLQFLSLILNSNTRPPDLDVHENASNAILMIEDEVKKISKINPNSFLDAL